MQAVVQLIHLLRNQSHTVVAVRVLGVTARPGTEYRGAVNHGAVENEVRDHIIKNPHDRRHDGDINRAITRGGNVRSGNANNDEQNDGDEAHHHPPAKMQAWCHGALHP